jgi:hypothetical protein
MAYGLPQFNYSIRVSNDNVAPVNGPNWLGPVMAQKYINSRSWLHLSSVATTIGPAIVQFRFEPVAFYAIFPRDQVSYWNLAMIEFDAAAAVYYRIWSWEVMHWGFPNEYPFAWAILADQTTGLYIPPGTANDDGLPVGFDYLMGPMP